MTKLDYIRRIAGIIVSLEEALQRSIQRQKDLKAKIRWFKEWVLPDETDALDWDPKIMKYDPDTDTVTIDYKDGIYVKVAESFHPHTPKKNSENREAILAWLENNGGESLLTLEVTLTFRRGEGKKARAVLKMLEEWPEPLTISKEKAIHHQNYQTFCRQQIQKGKDLPELLGVFNRRIAEIVDARAKTDEPILEHPIPGVSHQGYGDI